MREPFVDRPDPHSYYGKGQPKTTHVDWRAAVDFATRTLSCQATLHFNQGGEVDLDTRGLAIRTVTDGEGGTLQFERHEPDSLLGACLTVTVPANGRVRIVYRTTPEASGLQWLTPEQTAGRQHPFLFSQGQCLNARSFLPCQDTPGVRFTFTGELTVPRELRGLMAAQSLERREEGNFAVERWQMKNQVPAYLFAFAVGELENWEIGLRSRVWAEPSVVRAAAQEFAAVESLIRAGEALFGAYPWGEFSLLVPPPSFPYGGMENPTLAFITPAIIAGDRSLVYVVAHELAHAWFGNLVTNAGWRDFWLNEGWTTWAEGRILEAVYGVEQAMLVRALLAKQYERDCAAFATDGKSRYLRLVTDLTAVDPDEVLSRVPYHKGAMFLWALENHVGRERWDAFVRKYIARFRFQSLTTEQFLAFLDSELPGAAKAVDAEDWVYRSEGLPLNAPVIAGEAIRTAELYALSLRDAPTRAVGEKWTSAQWVLCLNLFKRQVDHFVCSEFARLRLGEHRSAEVRAAWLLLAVESGYEPALPYVRTFLGEVGRLAYLKPLYRALAASHHRGFQELATECFGQYCDRYHPVAQKVVQGLLDAALGVAATA
ncbi:MAG: M1 family metallopeptidase [Candidatus Magasanikbacteria bacterium]|nr:M1 family metallopeptidase [Candidatus Magasanikbacteria bacterium]